VPLPPPPVDAAPLNGPARRPGDKGHIPSHAPSVLAEPSPGRAATGQASPTGFMGRLPVGGEAAHPLDSASMFELAVVPHRSPSTQPFG
jgi:hypothetical protein